MCPPLSCPVRSFGEEIVTPCCCWPSGGRALGHRRLGDLGYRTQRRGSRAETVPHATSQAATMTDASCRGRAQPHTHTHCPHLIFPRHQPTAPIQRPTLVVSSDLIPIPCVLAIAARRRSSPATTRGCCSGACMTKIARMQHRAWELG